MAGWLDQQQQNEDWVEFKKELNKCFSQTKIFVSLYICNEFTILHGIIKILI